MFRWTETPATLGDIELSQYHFISLTSGSVNTTVRDSTRSVVFLNFSFDRAIGFYVLQVHLNIFFFSKLKCQISRKSRQ